VRHYNGLGSLGSCDQRNDDFLNGANKIRKLAIGTATAIDEPVSLVISIQRLPIASIHELVLRNCDHLAIIAVALSFGLLVVHEPNRGVINAVNYWRDNTSRNQNHSSSRNFRKSIYSAAFMCYFNSFV